MRLTDLFLPVFVYVAQLLRDLEVRHPLFGDVQGTVSRLLSATETPVRPGAGSAEEYDLARFAVCAWVDEMVAASPWEDRQLWLKEQLQRTYYRTTAAGAEFFERLERLSPDQGEAREIYYLCLVLGFTGRYCNPGDQSRLDELKNAQLALLLGAPAVSALERGDFLSDWGNQAPGSEAPRECARTRSRFSSLPTILCLGVPPLLFALLFVVYRFVLTSIGDSFLKGVGN
ncbi:DotU family type IV/VI secretion system protein [Geomesophilobacter sediminis]|uniref:DotU family type IV/VI secretion system protein n=1 Tax=Geomesophilobacter sediminis TaxID=2798584 RepID=A0A8J7IXD9_9BACT|nr:DotU family type IV/VI secretion system protein [Geomesophilobacter sediminis]MBJ6724532.1 DotU family type IV/VI secretion system protein [Geomesophilobacter sediminis]